jgi:hypothetical protein
MEKEENRTNVQQPNEDQRFELLIEKKISDAKLDISEKRLRFVITLGTVALAILGVAVPLLVTLHSSNRVDTTVQRIEDRVAAMMNSLTSKVDTSAQRAEDRFNQFSSSSSSRIDTAVNKMEDRFRELAGKQLRKPRLQCLLDGKPLEGSTLLLKRNSANRIQIRNIGDGPAEHVRAYLYLRNGSWELWMPMMSWQGAPFNDKPEYQLALAYDREIPIISPQASAPLYFSVWNREITEFKTPALLRIIYGEPSPYEVSFHFELKE